MARVTTGQSRWKRKKVFGTIQQMSRRRRRHYRDHNLPRSTPDLRYQKTGQPRSHVREGVSRGRVGGGNVRSGQPGGALIGLSIMCKDLLDRDVLSHSDPVVVVHEVDPQVQGGRFLGQTECQQNTLSPTFRTQIRVPYHFHQNQHLRFQVYDIDSRSFQQTGQVDPSRDDLLGMLQLSLADIVCSPGQIISSRLVEPGHLRSAVGQGMRRLGRGKKPKKRKPGKIIVRADVLTDQAAYGSYGYSPERVKFVEYVAGGLEIECVVAVDFTRSNGMPNQRSSLHSLVGRGQNPYEAAISSVGSILAPYDHDGVIPGLGFGADIGLGGVSHCFSLNGNQNDANCFGVQGILESYRQALNRVNLYGPTHFSEVIDFTANIARRSSMSHSVQKYFLLLILTDGAINDMEETIRAVVDASSLPMSIVIVGIGNDDFSSMRQLDSDHSLLSSRISGKQAVRDIVQFVPYNLAVRRGIKYLEEQVLMECPQNIVEYFQSHRLEPQARPEMNPDDMWDQAQDTWQSGNAWKSYETKKKGKWIAIGVAAAVAIGALGLYLWKKRRDSDVW